MVYPDALGIVFSPRQRCKTTRRSNRTQSVQPPTPSNYLGSTRRRLVLFRLFFFYRLRLLSDPSPRAVPSSPSRIRGCADNRWRRRRRRRRARARLGGAARARPLYRRFIVLRLRAPAVVQPNPSRPSSRSQHFQSTLFARDTIIDTVPSVCVITVELQWLHIHPSAAEPPRPSPSSSALWSPSSARRPSRRPTSTSRRPANTAVTYHPSTIIVFVVRFFSKIDTTCGKIYFFF